MYNCVWKKMKHLNNNEKTFEIGANNMRITTNINLCCEWCVWMPKNVIKCRLKCENRYWIWFTRQMIVFFVAKEYNFTRLFAFSRKWFRCIISIRCMYPNPLFNLLSVFRVSPEGIPETLAFWVRGYGDLFPLVCFFYNSVIRLLVFYCRWIHLLCGIFNLSWPLGP